MRTSRFFLSVVHFRFRCLGSRAHFASHLYLITNLLSRSITNILNCVTSSPNKCAGKYYNREVSIIRWQTATCFHTA